MAKYRIKKLISSVQGTTHTYYFSVEIKKFWLWRHLAYFMTVEDCKVYIEFHKKPSIIDYNG